MNARTNPFSFSEGPLDPAALQRELRDDTCGGFAAFEGWVRNHNEGHAVTRLEYEAFVPLAEKEGARIVAEAVRRFGVTQAACVHRIGSLGIGDIAVWVGVSAAHRDEAFRACRFIIDEVKHRVPIWKKEHYVTGDSGWVNCERCALPGAHEHGHVHSITASTPPRRRPRLTTRARSPCARWVRRARRACGPRPCWWWAPADSAFRCCSTWRVPAWAGSASSMATSSNPPTCTGRPGTHWPNVAVTRPALAAARVQALNPEVRVESHALRLDAGNAAQLVRDYDLVLDCTDNFGSKFLLNDVALRTGKPVLFASVYQYEGQLQLVAGDDASPCLRCVWPEATRDGIVGNCAEAGVLGPVPGVFGSLQALEALKLLLGLPGLAKNEMLIFDLITLSTQRLRARRADNCVAHQRAASPAATQNAEQPTRKG